MFGRALDLCRGSALSEGNTLFQQLSVMCSCPGEPHESMRASNMILAIHSEPHSIVLTLLQELTLLHQLLSTLFRPLLILEELSVPPSQV